MDKLKLVEEINRIIITCMYSNRNDSRQVAIEVLCVARKAITEECLGPNIRTREEVAAIVSMAAHGSWDMAESMIEVFCKVRRARLAEGTTMQDEIQDLCDQMDSYLNHTKGPSYAKDLLVEAYRRGKAQAETRRNND